MGVVLVRGAVGLVVVGRVLTTRVGAADGVSDGSYVGLYVEEDVGAGAPVS